MSLPVIIVGAGGHAGVVLDLLQLTAGNVLGFIDSDPAFLGKSAHGLKVLGGDEAVLDRHAPEQLLLANGVGGAMSTDARRHIFERFSARGYRFVTLRHPSATVARNTVLSEGAQVMAGAVLQAAVSIGRNTIVNTRTSIDHDCHIGAHAHIAPGSVLSGGVRVADGVHLGAGSVVIQGIRIGEGALVAAGSVVVQDVPAGGRVAGHPAKEMRA